MFSDQQSQKVNFLLNAALVAVEDVPEVDRTDRTSLQLQLEKATFHAASDDLLSMANLDRTLDQILKSKAFPRFKDVELLHVGFDGGVIPTTASPTPLVAPGRLTIQAALYYIKSTIAEQYGQLKVERSTMTLPSEKVAPFHYLFDGDRLTVNEQPAGAALEGTIASAQTLLLEQGARLIEDLKNSNSDRRLREAFAALHQKVSDGQDIVQLGLLNITFEGAIRGAESEISGVLAEVLRGHTIGVRHYLAQFPEWVQFSDAAAELEVTREDLGSLNAQVMVLAEALEKQAAVDEGVPRTLRLLADLSIDTPAKLRRAGLAIVRTLESLALSVFRRSASFAVSTIDRTMDKASILIATGLAPVIAITVIHVSATFIVSTDAAWLKPAAEIILKSEAQLLGK